MIEFCLGRTALRLDFSFFAVLTLFLLADPSGFGMAALFSCAVHELSHLAVMKAAGASVCRVTFYGAGIRISSDDVERLSPAPQAAVYAAGCLANAVLALAMILCGFDEAAAVSLFTGLFNLLPIGELDGARLLKLLVVRFARAERVDGVMRAAAAISAALCAAAAIALKGELSLTLITSAAYFVIMGLQKM